MPPLPDDLQNKKVLGTLYPLAAQAARILNYLADFPDAVSTPDPELAAHVGFVSAQHVAIVRRVLAETGLAEWIGFTTRLETTGKMLSRLGANLEGVAALT